MPYVMQTGVKKIVRVHLKTFKQEYYEDIVKLSEKSARAKLVGWGLLKPRRSALCWKCGDQMTK